MSNHLDIDDVTADYPMAARQLRDMRTALDAALDVVIDLGGEVREPEMDDARRLRKDAERYRWLRDNPRWAVGYRTRPRTGAKEWRMFDDGEYWGSWWPTHEQAIDHAMKLGAAVAAARAVGAA
jgi:hypothetical protein